MVKPVSRFVCALLCFVSSSLLADTGAATLDRLRGYDTATDTFLDDMTQQGNIDGGGFADVVSGTAATASHNGIIYTAVVREVGGGTITHVYLLRNRGIQFEGWDHDSKTWTTSYGNMDPIDSEVSLGYTAANPAMAIDSQGKVYVAYTRTIAAGADRKVFMSVYDPAQNDVFIWDDGAGPGPSERGELTNNLRAPEASRDSISNNAAASTIDADNVAPAIAIDSNDDVYIAYSTEMSAGADAKIFLSKFDASEEDAYIWDDGASHMTNNLRAPAAELDSFSVNVANFETSTSPAMAIDSNDKVYVAYLQEGIAGANNRIWLSMYDPDPADGHPTPIGPGSAGGDAYVWDDGATQFTNNLRAPTDELDSVGNNQSNNTDAQGSPAIGIDSNDNVYIAYIQQSENGADPKVWLSRYDPAARPAAVGDAGGDVFIWDDVATEMTNDQSQPDDELNSFGINAVAATDASGVPAMVIDRDDNVWVSYVQETAGPANPRVWISKYDPNARASSGPNDRGGDVFVWDDAASMLTNDQTAPGAQSGISWNQSADMDVVGSPSMALAENGDIYVAYAVESAGANNEHVSVSYLDVSEEDVYVWNNDATEWTNDLTVPTDFANSPDIASADGDTSDSPVLTSTTNGIYLNYKHRPDGTNDHLYAIRLGTGDSDGDGTPDVSDAFPLDETEDTDTDGDGTGNNADTDDDNDGTEDTNDAFPLDDSEDTDTDSDGAGNNADTDDDNDGVLDSEDAFPLDDSESVDTDGDGIGNNADTDDDNDGVLDVDDDFPLDPDRSKKKGSGSSGPVFLAMLLIMAAVRSRKFQSLISS